MHTLSTSSLNKHSEHFQRYEQRLLTAILLGAALGGTVVSSEAAVVPPAKSTEPARQSAGTTVPMKVLPKVKKGAKVQKVATLGGSRKIYRSLNEIEAQSVLAVVAVPLEDFLDRQHVATYLPDGEIAQTGTLGRYQVLRVLSTSPDLKGSVPEVLRVLEPVGLIDQPVVGLTKVTPEDYSEMRKGSTYILFLLRNKVGSYSLVGQTDGKYNVDGTDPQDDVEAAKIAANTASDSRRKNAPATTRKQGIRAEVLRKYGATLQ